jgi:hypothetical protein
VTRAAITHLAVLGAADGLLSDEGPRACSATTGADALPWQLDTTGFRNARGNATR